MTEPMERVRGDNPAGRKVLATRCPSCHAEPWQGCLLGVTNFGTVRSQSEIHSARVRAAVALSKEDRDHV